MILCYPSLYLCLKTLYEIHLIICHPFDIKTKTGSITFTSDIFIENVTIVTHIRKHVLLAQNKLTCRIPSRIFFSIYFKVDLALLTIEKNYKVLLPVRTSSHHICRRRRNVRSFSKARCSQCLRFSLWPPPRFHGAFVVWKSLNNYR